MLCKQSSRPIFIVLKSETFSKLTEFSEVWDVLILFVFIISFEMLEVFLLGSRNYRSSKLERKKSKSESFKIDYSFKKELNFQNLRPSLFLQTIKTTTFYISSYPIVQFTLNELQPTVLIP